MLSHSQLKIWLQKDLSRADKVLLVLAALAKPAKVNAIKDTARSVGCKMDGWNIATILARVKGSTLSVPDGYELAEKGQQRLSELGASKLTPAAAKVAMDLRKHLTAIKDRDVAAFLDEAIKCYESELYRSAIVMSWLAAVAVLQRQVIATHLAAFNAEAVKVDAKWKAANTVDDLGRMKEADFLDRATSISMIGKNVKQELSKALQLRNGCGHPSSLKVSANMAASHIELLLLNVFDKFAA